MKGKLIILSSMATVIVISIIGIIVSLISYNRTINVKTIEDYRSIKINLKNKIEKIKDKECQTSLNNMMNRIDDTYFSNNTNVKEYYEIYFNDDLTFLNYFDDVVNTCKLSSKDKNTIYIDALASTNYPNAIKKEYYLRYEFKIRDINSSKYLEENDLVGTYTTKYLELKVLNSLIEEV